MAHTAATEPATLPPVSSAARASTALFEVLMGDHTELWLGEIVPG